MAKRAIDEAVEAEKAAPQTVTMTVEQLRELVGSSTAGMTPEVLEHIMTKSAEMSAEAMRRSLKPENPHHPEISAFSYTEGDRTRPRPVLPFELIWKGFPVHKEPHVCAWWELEAYVQLTPGTYTCSLSDGSPLKVTVTPEYDVANTTITKLTVDFVITHDTRAKIPSPFVMAYQMNHADRDLDETFAEAMSQLLQIKVRDRKAKSALVA